MIKIIKKATKKTTNQFISIPVAISIILFLGLHQITLAQTQPTLTPVVKNIEEEVRARALLRNFNLRDMRHIRWPSELEENYNEKPGSFKSLDEKIMAVDKYCRRYAAHYSNEIEKSFSIRKGVLDFEAICESYQTSLKDLKDIKGIEAEVFNQFRPVLVSTFDYMFYSYYNSVIYKTNRVYDKSIFGRLGIPFQNSHIIFQVSILLLFTLNFFLLYKVFRS